jgi:hypothetical protein
MTDNYAELLRQTAKLYRESLAAPDTNDMCTLAYQWQDKKHRHVWDLCKELEKAADYNEKIKAQLELEVDDLKICRLERLELYIRMEKLELALKHCIRAISEWERKPEGIEPYLLGALDSACKALEWEDEK